MKHGILTFFTEFIHFLTLTLFFFNDTATTEIYTLSLHDALPIYDVPTALLDDFLDSLPLVELGLLLQEPDGIARSEEHTSELQSRLHLVCRLLLEKKRTNLELSR